MFVSFTGLVACVAMVALMPAQDSSPLALTTV